MNRQTKRAMAKQEQQRKAPTPKPPGAPTKRERTKPRQFFKEVVAELKKVAWPTRQEVFAYTVVVLVAVIVIAALIFAMDYLFTKLILALFGA